MVKKMKKNDVPLQRSLIITVLFLVTACWGAEKPTPSLIKNGGFEEDFAKGQPPGFRCAAIDSRTKAKATFNLSTNAFKGKKALSITRTNTESGYALYINILKRI